MSRWFGVFGVLLFAAGQWLVLYKPLRSAVLTTAQALRTHGAIWRTNRLRFRLGATLAAIVLLGILLPWPITVSAPLVVAPSLSIPLTAPDSGMVERVQVREGTRVPAGAPLLHIRNLELERQMVSHQRVADSLAIRSAEARARNQAAEVSLIDAARAVEEARAAGLRGRVAALGIRALSSGVVVTPRPEELAGRWVSNGEVVLRLGQPDSVEVRISLTGAGATLVKPGQPVRLLSRATLDRPLGAQLSAVSVAANSPETLEARVRLAAGDSWRPGMTGEASITIRRSNVWGALWWRVRRGIRTDLLL
jgi:multidrug efflux pump subunit AcrA (membrane-fusion protein)